MCRRIIYPYSHSHTAHCRRPNTRDCTPDAPVGSTYPARRRLLRLYRHVGVTAYMACRSPPRARTAVVKVEGEAAAEGFARREERLDVPKVNNARGRWTRSSSRSRLTGKADCAVTMAVRREPARLRSRLDVRGHQAKVDRLDSERCLAYHLHYQR
ncbi:hypothetical protein EDB86DRAFT_1025218 [Lactarius hatsudake]|nr:hypothetical protein EDB86DRAFT_1025218 [Lactarius hatsudake]